MIENTAKTAKDNPLSTLLTAGGQGGIEAQEARGQEELVNSTSLPTDIRRGGKEILEAAGVVFGEPLRDDPMFCEAKLPQGWKKQATDHSMHSDLIDEKGRKRAGIFYKAAFYDRSAHMSATHRFRLDSYSRFPYGSGKSQSVALDSDGTVLFESAVYNEEDFEKSYEAIDKADAEAKAWLNENWPNWEDPSAYWD